MHGFFVSFLLFSFHVGFFLFFHSGSFKRKLMRMLVYVYRVNETFTINRNITIHATKKRIGFWLKVDATQDSWIENQPIEPIIQWFDRSTVKIETKQKQDKKKKEKMKIKIEIQRMIRANKQNQSWRIIKNLLIDTVFFYSIITLFWPLIIIRLFTI